MATTNADTPDSPPTSTCTVDDSESKMESAEKCDYPACGPQNDCNNGTSDAGANGGDAASVDQQDGVPSDQTHSQRTKGKIHCTGTSILIAIVISALIMLAAMIAGLGVYVSHLHMELDRISDRVDRLEIQCSGGCNILSTNKTWPNSEVGVDELSMQISNLSMEIKGVKNSMSTLQNGIQSVQATHENDIDQIRKNVSTMLTQINTSLIGSLQRFVDRAASNISELDKNVQRELSDMRNHSLMLAQNVSVLIEQVSLLDRRSDEVKMNVIALESNVNERLSRLTVNVSSNEELLRDMSATQVEHTAMIEQMRRNISSAEQQWSNAREYLTATLSSLNNSLSQIDTSHRAYLRNLSLDLNDLSSELMATKEVFFANTSALREELIELSEGLDYTNDNLTDLSSAQKQILLDLADIKEIHSGNISAIGLSLVHLNEELGETNEHLENLSSVQDGLQRNLGLTNEALRSNVLDLELKFNREINRTQEQLQSQYTELWLNLGTTRDRLEANISALQESHGHLQEDLDRTKVKLRTLSSEHVDLQGDYNTTKRAFYTTKTAIEQNVTQVRTLINNHSSVLGEHSGLLGDAAQSRSILSGRIDGTSDSVRTLGTLVSTIRSNVTLVQNSVISLSGTLTTNVNSLNTRINDHVDWIQHSLDGQSQTLTNFGSRISAVEQQLASDAVRVVPLGFLLLSAIALFVCYVVMF